MSSIGPSTTAPLSTATATAPTPAAGSTCAGGAPAPISTPSPVQAPLPTATTAGGDTALQGAAALGQDPGMAGVLQSLVATLQQLVSLLSAQAGAAQPAAAAGPSAIPADMAQIDKLAGGYVDPRHDLDGDGQINIATEAAHDLVRPDGVKVRSDITQLSQAADQAGNRDGKASVDEYRAALGKFDTGGTTSPAADGLLDAAERAAWNASGQSPTVQTL